MELKPGMSALVTGGGAGIGKALSLALAQKGLFVTVVDFSEENGKEAASLLEKENAKFHTGLNFPSALFIKCDVTNASQMAAAFEKHLETYGGLDICINNAGIATMVPIDTDETNGIDTWRRTVSVNLIAVIDCTRIAIQAMRSRKKPGVIINLGSAAGLYPLYQEPIYSATKGGVIMFTKSLAPLRSEGIRVNVLCPEFVDTELGRQGDPNFVKFLQGFLPMEMVVNGAFELITDETKAGACLWVSNCSGMEYCLSPLEKVYSEGLGI